MKRPREHSFTDFLVELLIYGLFVALYVFLIFHYLTDWLKSMFSDNRIEYAVSALVLMLVQSIGLERVTTGLLSFIRRRNR
jgi:Kef-type K+ transport system membrane component KefB